MLFRSSSSIPFFAPVVKLSNYHLLDGAIKEPIPYTKALDDGFNKFVIVLTRNEGYQKKAPVPPYLLRLVYHKYPKLWELMAQRPALYNDQLAFAEKLADEGKAVLIRPTKPLKVDRFNMKKDKLLALYEHGYECGQSKIGDILKLM